MVPYDIEVTTVIGPILIVLFVVVSMVVLYFSDKGPKS